MLIHICLDFGFQFSVFSFQQGDLDRKLLTIPDFAGSLK
jgi:hypothetical protein